MRTSNVGPTEAGMAGLQTKKKTGTARMTEAVIEGPEPREKVRITTQVATITSSSIESEGRKTTTSARELETITGTVITRRVEGPTFDAKLPLPTWNIIFERRKHGSHGTNNNKNGTW